MKARTLPAATIFFHVLILAALAASVFPRSAGARRPPRRPPATGGPVSAQDPASTLASKSKALPLIIYVKDRVLSTRRLDWSSVMVPGEQISVSVVPTNQDIRSVVTRFTRMSRLFLRAGSLLLTHQPGPASRSEKNAGAPILSRGKTLLRLHKGRVVSDPIIAVGTTRCQSPAPGFDLPSRKGSRSKSPWRWVFDGSGGIVGLQLCSETRSDGNVVDFVLPLPAIKSRARVLAGIASTLPSPGRLPRMSIDIALASPSGTFVSRGHVLLEKNTAFVATRGAQAPISVQRATGTHGYHAAIRAEVSAHGLAAVRLAAVSTALPAPLGSSSGKASVRQGHTNAFYMLRWPGLFEITASKPVTGPARANAPSVFLGPLGSSCRHDTDLFPILNSRGQLEAARIGCGTRTLPGGSLTYQVAHHVSVLRALIPLLDIKERASTQKRLKTLAAVRKALDGFLRGSLVTVRMKGATTDMPGLLVGGGRVVTGYTKPGATYTVLSDRLSSTPVMGVPEEATPSGWVGGTTLITEPRLFPRGGSVLPSRTPSLCMNKPTWILALAKSSRKKTEVLSIFHHPTYRVLYTKKPVSRRSFHLHEGLPLFVVCDGGLTTYKQVEGRSLSIAIANKWSAMAPEGGFFVPFPSWIPLARDKRHIYRRRALPVDPYRWRQGRVVIPPKPPRKARSRRRIVHPKDWHGQLEVGLSTGFLAMGQELARDGSELSRKEATAYVGISFIPRVTWWRNPSVRRRYIPGNLFRPHRKHSARNALLGNQLSVELPIRLEYAFPLDDQPHGLRFSMGIGVTLEQQLTDRWQFPSSLSLILPEVGFSVTTLQGGKRSAGPYLSIMRIPITYWLDSKTAIRFRLAPYLGLRSTENPNWPRRHLRSEIGFNFTAGMVFRGGS